MGDINVAVIQSFMNWMAEASKRGRKNDLNSQTIARVCGLVSHIFKIAVEMGVVTDNPVKPTFYAILESTPDTTELRTMWMWTR